MPDATLTRARRLHLARVRLDRRNQFGHRLVRRVRSNLNTRRVGIDKRDRRVRRAVELGQFLPVHHPDLDGDDADRVAVGRGLGDRAVTDDATAAGAVHDVDRLAQLLFEQYADDAGRRVGAAAGSPRHDQRDRALGVGGEGRPCEQ
jgi:hypothetical protein